MDDDANLTKKQKQKQINIILKMNREFRQKLKISYQKKSDRRHT